MMLLHDSRRDARSRERARADRRPGPVARGRRRDRRGTRRSRAGALAGRRRALRPAGGGSRPAHRDVLRLEQVAELYAELSRLAGSPVVELDRAIAIAETEGPEAGLRVVDGLASRTSATCTPPGVSCCAGSGGPVRRATPIEGHESSPTTAPNVASSSAGSRSRQARTRDSRGRPTAPAPWRGPRRGTGPEPLATTSEGTAPPLRHRAAGGRAGPSFSRRLCSSLRSEAPFFPQDPQVAPSRANSGS